jgi:hypothetical protein
MIRSRRRRGLKKGWFVKIVRWGLKLRCIDEFTQISRPEDGLPASNSNTRLHDTASRLFVFIEFKIEEDEFLFNLVLEKNGVHSAWYLPA